MILKSSLPNFPAAIAQLPLRLHEKLALVFIHQAPDVSNERLAQVLGMQPRGAQDMLRRLREHGFIYGQRKGRARSMWLTFHVEQHVGRGDA